ncbi:uncharacterized protein MONOS_7825 [Monocercomonoides exilis]|uniref:uncharacterized protein n=1 Tax=Monocercomonoides exilis TaxID=2049356 RepID=UPI003559D4AD|nr:hypothetical protein MONOS_7825 [Monocercomonoides exilis]|eukprot:MONOS_7825.1-p1 / transcript=MONOS_7825.1 / gene=MONOS_7825 / organism=Monocercomonoides_exilis_PA203 / gene_product=unspecified product / transcript_product=unspecified product / location=Mono_scaffold00278:6702-7514(+) / protein_length=271 / sequence_SO=supercontig / SO=protein_coding / is_pseudo=false
MSVKADIKEAKMKLRFNGTDFFPCRLGFSVSIKRIGNTWKEKEFELDMIENETSAVGAFDLDFLDPSRSSDKLEVCLMAVGSGGGVEGSSRIGTSQWLSFSIAKDEPSITNGTKADDAEAKKEAEEKKAKTIVIVCFSMAGLFLAVSFGLIVYVVLIASRTNKMKKQLEEGSSMKSRRKKKRKRVSVESGKTGENTDQKKPEESLKYEELLNDYMLQSLSISPFAITKSFSLLSSSSTSPTPSTSSTSSSSSSSFRTASPLSSNSLMNSP